MNLVILHTNDLHGHLAPWQGWAGELKGKPIGGLGVLGGAIAAQRRDASGSCLLLDAGDMLKELKERAAEKRTAQVGSH